ncbi:MAG: GGDEF domain-containing protein [Armatimonadetes bacterium]|nr:GGDEF domain-containing protein [Armatimonadota bacterium]
MSREFAEEFTEEMDLRPSEEEVERVKEPCLMSMAGKSRGVLFRLREGEVVVGRSAEKADIVLEERGVSRAHARLTCGPDGVVTLLDLDSTNGTYVNGKKVTSVLLADGDTINFGPEATVRLDYQDTVEQKLLEHLYKNATRDGLTGVLNKKSFLERLEEQFAVTTRHGQRVCLAMIDADNFKRINDTYGHPAGDAVLKALARRVVSLVRKADLVGRYGGEEFIILIRETDVDGARVLLDRIRAAVEEMPFVVPAEGGERPISMTISVGVAGLDVSAGIEESLERADQALYRAKNSGRNQVVIHGEA